MQSLKYSFIVAMVHNLFMFVYHNFYIYFISLHVITSIFLLTKTKIAQLSGHCFDCIILLYNVFDKHPYAPIIRWNNCVSSKAIVT